ncbi:MAG: hypothetical protein GX958_04485 [Desulfitobacterium sp.]|nr:hypothetical protein [Desulfitobacterium sp.]
MSKAQLTVDEVRKILGISKSHAYKVIRELNEELKQLGFYTVRGKVSKKFFNEKYYGILD